VVVDCAEAGEVSGDFEKPANSSDAESLFDDYQARVERGLTTPFEEFCSAHPEHAEELRRMQADHDRVVSLFRDRGDLSDSDAGPWDVSEGRVIGDFRLVRRLGRGGMGEVWEARQLSLDRSVALKLLLPERLNTRGLDYFSREARAGGKLAHPGIVSVYGTGEEDGLHWIAMELVEGGCDLRRTLESFRGNEETDEEFYRQVAEFMAEVADAVQAAHDVGVIHRDLKPANVLVTPDEHPKLTDFGLARLVDENSISMAGDIIGTYYYMSPEQVAARRAGLDHRTDIFSLGVVLYEMLTLTRPFDGDTTEQVAHKILWVDPPSPKDLRSRVPQDLAVICGKAMEKDRNRRYSSMAEFAADLRRYLAQEPILARPSGALVRMAKWARRNPTRSVAAAIVAVALVAITALAWQLSLQKNLLQIERDNLDNSNRALGRQSAEAERQAKLATQRAEELAFTNVKLREQRAKAEEARAEAASERDQAQLRAEELQQVSDFQVAQLAGVDPEVMGLALRRTVLEWVGAAGARAGSDAEASGDESIELERLLAGADFTGIALDVLGEQVFGGALEALEDFENQPLVQARLLQVVGDAMEALGLLDRALQPQEQALAIRRQELGDEDHDTLISITQLGLLRQGLGDYAEAEALLREVMETRRRTLGEEHIYTLSSMNNLGALLHVRGKLPEAELLLQGVLEVRRRLLEDGHPSTLSSINNLAGLLKTRGEFAEAEPLYREALRVRRQTLGDEDPNTLTSIGNLAGLLQVRGQLSDAEPLLREALGVYRRTRGDKHPDTLRSMNNLGSLLQARGELDEAESLFREALAGRRRTLGSEHPSTLNSIGNLGTLLQARGRLDDAEPLLRETLAQRRRALGDTHYNTLISINNLAALLEAKGEFAEAEPLYREGILGFRRAFGDGHTNTLTLTFNLGVLLKASGRLSEAEPLMREALAGFRDKLGDAHQTTVTVIASLGTVLFEMDKLEEAEPLLREALVGFRSRWGEGHAKTRGLKQSLEILLERRKASGAPSAEKRRG